jgi:hypothetical protein
VPESVAVGHANRDRSTPRSGTLPPRSRGGIGRRLFGDRSRASPAKRAATPFVTATPLVSPSVSRTATSNFSSRSATRGGDGFGRQPFRKTAPRRAAQHRERTEALGGSLEIRSGAGSGTTDPRVPAHVTSRRYIDDEVPGARYAVLAGTCSSISVPAPRSLPTSSCPFTIAARARIPGRPKWPSTCCRAIVSASIPS